MSRLDLARALIVGEILAETDPEVAAAKRAVLHERALEIIATHGTGTSGGVYMTVRFLVKPFGGVFRTQVKVDVVESQIYYPFAYPIKVTEKSDVEVRAVCNKNQANALSASFNGVLIDNGDAL